METTIEKYNRLDVVITGRQLPTYITESNLIVLHFDDNYINYYDCNDEKICYDWRRYRKLSTMMNGSLRITCCDNEVSLDSLVCISCGSEL